MTTFLMITLIIGGVFAFFNLPVSDLPNVEHPHIQVTAGNAGASPETILNQITIPLEKELTHVKGVTEMSSTSSPGFSKISLSFDLSKNMDEAIRDVQAAINRADPLLPREVDPRPSYELQEDSQDPIIWILLTSDIQSTEELHTFADTHFVPRVTRIEGVAQVKIFGMEKSTWLRINPELMAARKIGFNQVVDTVRQHTAQLPLGSIQTTHKLLSIEWPTSIKAAKDLESVKITGTDVRLTDIGELSDTSIQQRKFNYIENGAASKMIALGIQKISEGNTVAISKAVAEVMESVREELPPDIQMRLWFDKAKWIEESLFDVQLSLLIAFSLVVIVIYLSLGRFAESVIASIALPLSLVGTFIGMYFLGFSLDLLSLLALTLAVGFVVDDAIVVLENIVRWQEKGESPMQASLIGSKQICFTILSMTISLVAVFIPLLFMPGMNGRLFREFSVTLAMAILVSGVISLTLTPMLCSRFLKPHQKHSPLQEKIDHVNRSAVSLYGKTLQACLGFPKTILAIAVFCTVATGYLFTKLDVDLIPPEDRGYFFAIVNLPKGMEAAQVGEQQQRLETLIDENPHIAKYISLDIHNSLIFIMKLFDSDKRPPIMAVIGDVQKIFDSIPGTQTYIQPYKLLDLDIDFGSGGQYKYVVKGTEFDDVEASTNALVEAMQKTPQITFVLSSLTNDSPILSLNVNEELAHKYGFEKQQIQSLILNAFGQGSVGSIQKGTKREKIYMELLPEFQNYVDAPNNLYLKTSLGSLVPLRALAEWNEKLGSPNLVRKDQLPAATIRFSLDPSIPAKEGIELVQQIAEGIFPTNVSGSPSGAAKAIGSATRDTLLLLIAAALVMYIVLGILYESFIHPLTILSSIPFASLGGVLTLLLFGEPISIFSAVGFLLLIGIVKKNGIMMVDYAIEAQRDGLEPVKAIYEACLTRFRPIMMTTTAAVMGAVPIAIGYGDGSEMRRGLGLVIVGGLLFSQLLTLYVTPVIYLTFGKLSKQGRERLAESST